ncbi:MAG: PAS domain-containing sensor histidine kinase [Alphaproteobacteria bacterium]|nr:PAS domain-containing sensor histidine kinase [Alphaproteobacteria bacterium]
MRWTTSLIGRLGVQRSTALLVALVWVLANIIVEVGYSFDGVPFSERPAIGFLPWIMPIVLGYPMILLLVRIIARLGSVESDLRRSETKFRNLLEGSLQGVCVHRHMVPVFATQPFAEIFGYDSVDEIMTAGSILPLFAPEEHEAMARNAEARLRGDDLPSIFERRALRRDGVHIWIEIRATRVIWDGEPAALATFIDITQRKNIDRMKNDFISTVSHELRTPLTSISGSLGLISAGMAGKIPEEAHSLVKIANNNSDRLVRLINDILDIEKIESGRMEIEFYPIQVWSLLEMAAESNRGFAERFGISIEISSATEDARVLGSADQLMQVFTNLLSNAIKFSPMRASIEVGARRTLGGTIRFSVTDHGRGIPLDFRDRIFDKFTQADQNEQRGSGTGLGLSICKLLVERHQGKIGFSSDIGTGSTFYFELPEYIEDSAIGDETIGQSATA